MEPKIILVESPKKITYDDLRCTSCGSKNYFQTLRGCLGGIAEDNNRYTCLDCGHTGEVKDMYNALVEEL